MFLGPDSIGFVWGGVGRALMQFMHFSAIFGMLGVLATSVTLWYPLSGVRVRMLCQYMLTRMRKNVFCSL